MDTKKGVSPGGAGPYIRLRVGINVAKPLKKWVLFRPVESLESDRYEIEYERLPHFCFFCGMLSHVGRNCPRKLAGELTAPAYDGLMKAERKEEWLIQQIQSK